MHVQEAAGLDFVVGVVSLPAYLFHSPGDSLESRLLKMCNSLEAALIKEEEEEYLSYLSLEARECLGSRFGWRGEEERRKTSRFIRYCMECCASYIYPTFHLDTQAVQCLPCYRA